MTIDSLPAAAVANAGPNLLPLLVWAVAIGAALLASVQRAGELGRLRAELAELRESAAQAARAAARTSRRAGPMFAGLYQEQPHNGSAGAMLATVAAAVFGMVGGGLFWRDASRHAAAPLVAPTELARIQHNQDSLAVLVGQLHDSLRLVMAAKAGAAPKFAASAARKVPAASNIPSIAPPPKFSPSGFGVGVQSATPPDSSRHRTP